MGAQDDEARPASYLSKSWVMALLCWGEGGQKALVESRRYPQWPLKDVWDYLGMQSTPVRVPPAELFGLIAWNHARKISQSMCGQRINEDPSLRNS